MSRSRYLKPTFFTNERVGELTPLERLAWQGLWCQADREGRLKDSPKRLKVEILPYDDCDFEALLEGLQVAGFIVRYEAAGQRLIWLPSFPEHQSPHHKEPPSTLPPYMHAPSTGQASINHAASLPQASAMLPAILPPESESESDLIDQQLAHAREAAAPAAAAPAAAAAAAAEALYFGVLIPTAIRDRVIEHCEALGPRNLDAETVQAVVQCHEDLPAEDIDWARKQLRRAVPRKAPWPANVREVIAQRDGVPTPIAQRPQQERIPMAEEVFEQIRNRPAVPVPDELEYLRANDPEAYERELAHRERSRAKLAAHMAAKEQAT